MARTSRLAAFRQVTKHAVNPLTDAVSQTLYTRYSGKLENTQRAQTYANAVYFSGFSIWQGVSQLVWVKVIFNLLHNFTTKRQI